MHIRKNCIGGKLQYCKLRRMNSPLVKDTRDFSCPYFQTAMNLNTLFNNEP